MVFKLSEDSCYIIDRGLYEYKMAIDNMGFMLARHAEDENADFLNSTIFEKLHEKAILAAAGRWYRETGIIEQYVQEPVKFYSFDLTNGMLTVEIK